MPADEITENQLSFFARLPSEVLEHVLAQLPIMALIRVNRVNRLWRCLVQNVCRIKLNAYFPDWQEDLNSIAIFMNADGKFEPDWKVHLAKVHYLHFGKLKDDMQDFFYAVLDGNERKIEAYLSKTAGSSYLEQISKNGMAAIHYAALYNKLDVIRICAAYTNNINQPDKIGNTALHIAARKGRVDIVKYLLVIPGIDKTKENKIGMAPFHLAVESGQLAIIDLFIKGGIDINQPDKIGNTALHIAAQKGYVDIVKYLLAIPEIDKTKENKIGMAPFHLAVKSGQLAIIDLFIEDGIDINQEEKFGESPLHIAIKNRQLKAVKRLLNEPAININHQRENLLNITPLHYAAEKGDLEIVEILLKQPDININVPELCTNETPLFYAVKKGCLPIANLLLERQAVIEPAGCFDKLLHLAAKGGDESYSRQNFIYYYRC